MKKYIDLNSIKISKKIITSIKERCKLENINTKDMFVHYDKNIHIRFHNYDHFDLILNDEEWMPVHSC